MLEPQRDDGFAQFRAGSPPFLGQEELGHLLCDGRPAFCQSQKPYIVGRGPDNCDGIDARVLVEPPVLRRDRRLRDARRDVPRDDPVPPRLSRGKRLIQNHSMTIDDRRRRRITWVDRRQRPVAQPKRGRSRQGKN